MKMIFELVTILYLAQSDSSIFIQPILGKSISQPIIHSVCFNLPKLVQTVHLTLC